MVSHKFLFQDGWASTSSNGDKANDWFDKGSEFINSGDYGQAVEAFDNVLKLDPENIDALINKGVAFRYLGQYEQSLAAYEKALEERPDDADIWYNKGIVLGYLGEYENAITAFDKALQIDPRDSSTLNNKGVALLNLGRYSEAEVLFYEVLEIDPENEDALKNSDLVASYLNATSDSISTPAINLSISGSEETTEGSDFKQYSNDDFGFTIGYPSTWTKEELSFDPEVNSYVVEFDSPVEGQDDLYSDFLNVQIRPFNSLEFGVEEENPDEETVEALQHLTLIGYGLDIIEEYKNTFDNFQNLSLDVVKLGGEPAYSLTQTHTLRLPTGEVNLKVLETGTKVGDKVYSLHYTAEEDNYSKYLPVVENMIKSFQLVSSSGNVNGQETGQSEVTPDESTLSTSQSAYKSYENTDHKIQAQIPSHWEVDEKDLNPDDTISEIAYFLSPLTGSSDGYHEIVGIFSEKLTSVYNSSSDYLNYSIDGYSQTQDFELISANANTEFAGKPGYSLIYTSTLKEGDDDLKLKTMEIGTILGDKSYYISYSAQSENYEKYLPHVQQIIDSIEVLDDRL